MHIELPIDLSLLVSNSLRCFSKLMVYRCLVGMGGDWEAPPLANPQTAKTNGWTPLMLAARPDGFFLLLGGGPFRSPPPPPGQATGRRSGGGVATHCSMCQRASHLRSWYPNLIGRYSTCCPAPPPWKVGLSRCHRRFAFMLHRLFASPIRCSSLLSSPS